MAKRVLPKVLDLGKESWMLKTTLTNLNMLKKATSRQEYQHTAIDEILGYLEQIVSEKDTS